MRLNEKAQKWIKHSLNSPIVEILAKNSNLTRIQLETFLIDILSETIAGKSLKYDEKARIRISAVSRGAFNRTLRQARRNVIRSVYTILLLGYLGVFEDTRLDPYLEVSNKLQTYVETHRELQGKETKEDHLRIIYLLQKELKSSLEQLSRPRALSQKM